MQIEGTSEDNEQIVLTCAIHQKYNTKVSGNAFMPDDAIGVYIVGTANEQSAPLNSQNNHADNVRFVYDGTLWKSNTQLYWNNLEFADAYSYYPYQWEIADVHSVPVSVAHRQDRDGGYENSDFLWASVKAVKSKQSFNLMHRHLLSMVRVSLLEGTGFADGEWEGSSVALSVANTITNAYVDLQDGSVMPDSKSQSQSIVPVKKGDSWEAVVIPQTISEGTSLIQITINGRLYSFKRQENTCYESGKQYTFALRVDKTSAVSYTFSLVSESISEWESGISKSGDSRQYISVNLENRDELKDKLNDLKIDYRKLKNLKISGILSSSDYVFIKDSLRCLQDLNLQDAIVEGFEYTGELPDYDGERFFSGEGVMPSYGYAPETSLTHVILPSSLKIIGYQCFDQVPLSQELIIPDNVSHIGSYAFSAGPMGGTSPGSIFGLYLPSSIEFIGEGAFQNQGITNELVLPNTLKYLGPNAFYGCVNIRGHLHLPSSLLSIHEHTFELMRGVSGILDIPSNITSIGNRAFSMTGFEGLQLNEGLLSIGDYAFAGVNESYMLDYWYDGEYYTKSIFGGELIVPESVRHIGNAAFANTSFRHVYLPDNFEELPEGLFAYCRELTDTVYVPSKVNHLSEKVFKNCEKLKAVILPENLLNISSRCFENCYDLDYIQCLSTTPPELDGSGHFDGVPKDNFTLIVPEGCVEAYQNAPGWSEFKRISEYRDFVCRPQRVKLLNKGITRRIVLNSEGEWTVSSIPSWVHISQLSGTKKTELTVDIDALPKGSASRRGSIEFTLKGKGYVTRYDIEQIDSDYEEDASIVLQSATKGEGINMVFLGDGYDASDIASGQYVNDMKRGMEYFFDVEPYKTYREYFNVYTAIALSNESGIGTLNTKRDVKFKTIGGSGSLRLTMDFDSALFYAVDHTPVEDSMMSGLTCIVIPNTDIYDGVTAMYPNGAAVALCPKSSKEYPYDARGLIQHEAGGHAFAKLADEYIYHYSWIQTCKCQCCEHVEALMDMQALGWGMNLSLDGKYKSVPWAHMINDNRFNDIVDVYEGGYFHKKGVYRSEYNSCMNNNVPYFSSWSREIIVRRIMELAGLTYSYERFVASDSRQWGQDFTTKSDRSNDDFSPAPLEGQAPIIVSHNPIRRK